jgi:hypothetical protein
VCVRADDTVLIAALARALVETEARRAGGLQPLLLGERLPSPLRIPYALVIRPQAVTVTI